MSYKFEITKDPDLIPVPSKTVLNEQSHSLVAKTNSSNQDIYLEFSTRETLRDFALNILHESIYGKDRIELYPLGTEKGWEVVNGVRLSEKSARIFITFPNENT